MNIDNIPEAFQTKLRVAVLAAVYSGEKDFNSLKELLDTTDGNLSVQLSKLEAYGYVDIRKETLKRKSRTVCTVTELGRKAFAEYVEMLTRSLLPKED